MGSPSWGRTSQPHSNRKDWYNIKHMLPFIWDYKGRVLFALLCLVISKLAMVGVPIVLKYIVDALDKSQNEQAIVLPIVLLFAYGVLRLMSSGFNELRDVVFARVRYHAMNTLSVSTMKHIHQLSLRFHLERNTGAISRDMERGAQSFSSILNYLVFNIIPTFAEFLLVAGILTVQYDNSFTLVIVLTVVTYITFTFFLTEWRMHYRHEMNAYDSQANGKAMDSLINYETVKYFNNENLEIKRYESTMHDWEDSAVKSQSTMSLLNFGQGSIIAVGVTFIMFFAAQGVVDGSMTLGDLVLVNTMMLQLFLPLGFLGIIYRALKYALADMDNVINLLKTPVEIEDVSNAKVLHVDQKNSDVEFNEVGFAYNENRQILSNISFHIPSGKKLALVGASGSGKSTIARLVFRFYDINSGSIKIAGQQISQVTQQSLREHIGIVPQDTVLFNDSIAYNIAYAKSGASQEEIEKATKAADIHDFIISLPDGYDTIVGERGLKLSGGEKQRISIARVLLKDPEILVFDEATSSLDSHSESNILKSLKALANNKTTLVIAHRLSTVVDADTIIVLSEGNVIEQGTHAELLTKKGHYASMWELQQKDDEKETVVS
ncbi:MAG: ABC transporter ATP-binding protein/permease [Gammaproteobacteria bacterium]|nr:ABC transporter ATP-binding protein/permease [Gammaproteobacteria bacterium]